MKVLEYLEKILVLNFEQVQFYYSVIGVMLI